MSELHVVHVFGSDYAPETGWRLLQWCADRGATDFNVHGIICDGRGDEALKPFDRLAEASRLDPAPRKDLSHGDVRELELWSLNKQTLDALRLAFPQGLFDYNPAADAWFEDLTVYRSGELLLGIITHEAEGVLRLSPSDLSSFRSAGFVAQAQGKWVAYA